MCDVVEVLAKAMVAILLQYMNVSNQHVVHLELRQCYMSHMFRLREKEQTLGISLVDQWLRLCASTAGGAGLIPGRGAKIPHAVRCGQKFINKNLSKGRILSNLFCE